MLSTSPIEFVTQFGDGQLDAIQAFRNGFFYELTGSTAEPGDELIDPLDQQSFHHVALCGSEMVGAIRVTDGPTFDHPSVCLGKYRIDALIEQFGMHHLAYVSRLAIAPAYRNGSVMLRLLRAAYTSAMTRGIRAGFSDCSPQLFPLYRSLGYEDTGVRFTHDLFGPKMVIVIVTREHADRLRGRGV